MDDALLIQDFLQPLALSGILNDEQLNEAQLGSYIKTYEHTFPELDACSIVLVGVTEERGTGNGVSVSSAPDIIRRNLYRLYHWHTDLQVADVGNVKPGATLSDTYAAVRLVVAALVGAGKTVILLGGSHDCTLAQYGAYVQRNEVVEVSCIDAFINLSTHTAIRSENFLMEMLTGDPNYIRHYNHIAFQSYFVHPQMLQTMDKLRFDCFRVGVVKELPEEMEPVIRTSNLLSIDMAALAYSAAPANRSSPNGLNGAEICTLTRFAGMSDVLTSIGIYGYNPSYDVDELTAIQIAHMIWYFIDGRNKARYEAPLTDRNSFNEFHTVFNEVDSLFLQSKKTGRWWMQLPDGRFIACTARDYQLAIHNEIPERWLRAQERDV